MNNKKILLFQVEKDKKKQIVAVCKALDIQPVIVPRGQYEETLGALAGIDGFTLSGKGYAGEPFHTDMMVFSGIPSDALDVFLQEYKAAGIAPIPLKAVLTPHNIFWNVRQLYEELQKEHAAFDHLT